MRRGALVVAAVMALGICFVGCKPEPPPAPPPAAPPPPSAQEIQAEIVKCVVPLQGLVAESGGKGIGEGGRGATAGLTDDVQTTVVNCLRTARSKYQSSENGPQGISLATHDLEDLISKARDQQRYRLVLGCIQAYEALAPGSTKMNRLKERAQLFIKRPLVHVRGYVDDKETNETYAFLEVEVLPSHEVQNVKVRPGEEFCGLRFIEIVGDKKGVLLEYLAIPGNTFRVMGP